MNESKKIGVVGMLCVLLAGAVGVAKAALVECPVIADTVLAGHDAEKNTNCGARERLRVKGWQGIVIFRFDMAKLKGMKAKGGAISLYCAGITGDAAGKTMSEGVSTISHDWIEGAGDYTADENSATYLWPGKPIDKQWGKKNEEPSDRYGQNDAMDVVNGFGGSIKNKKGDWEFVLDKWTEIALDAEVVQGLMDGTQYGIAILRNSVGVNLDLASREFQGGASKPKLVVDSSGLSVEPRGKLASTWSEIKR